MKIRLIHIRHSTVFSKKMLDKIFVLAFTLQLSLLSLYSFSQSGVSVNTTGTPADNTAILDVSSTAQGFLIPRMTALQRDNISSPYQSLLIFNITTNCFEAYVNGSWFSISCPACIPPLSPLAKPATNICSNQFTANWNPSAGATAYYLDVSTDAGFLSFVSGFSNLNVGNIISFNVTGLFPNTQYFYRVRAFAVCSSGNSNTISVLTTPAPYSPPVPPCQASTFTVTHTAGSVAPMTVTINYNQVQTNLSGSNECWITQNLGASQQASSQDDTSKVARGWYWQFNRIQGYQVYIRNNSASQSVITPNSWNSLADNSGSDWSPCNDPCSLLLGQGWRLPTLTEWSTANSNAGWRVINDAYNSVLKIDGSGYLDPSNGWLYDLYHEDTGPGYTSAGFYWSSSGDSGNLTLGRSWFFSLSTDCCNREALPHTVKSQGNAVRCLNP
jgi:hypothetical protein